MSFNAKCNIISPMEKKKIMIITSYIEGEKDKIDELIRDTAADFIICADGGVVYAERAGITPDLIVGDFDSLGHAPKGDNVIKVPVEKDDTDTMLAVKTALERGCDTVCIYGGTGGKRLDHTLANLQTLLYLRRRGARGYLYDNDFVWTAIENETLTVEQTVEWGLLSVFSLEGRAAGIDEAGVQYPLSRASLTAEFPLGVSNHIIAPKARITVRQGALLVGWELPPTGVVSEIK